MKWIAGFLVAGVVSFAGVSLMAGSAPERAASPSPSPVVVKVPKVPVVAPVVKDVPKPVVERGEERPTDPDVIILDGYEGQIEQGAFFSRRGPVRAQTTQAKPIN